jgi:hypothetical protein
MLTVTGTGLERLFARIHRPYDADAVVEALLGLPHGVVHQLVGAAIATSDEAEDLLDAMPVTLRSLAIATTDRAERCHGEIRGPVLWSETMSARASSAGDAGVYVCAMPSKAFDTDENRVLVAALRALQRGARAVERGDRAGYDDDVLSRARMNGMRAQRYLDHRALMTVTKTDRPTGRALRRTRAGTRRHTYWHALRMLERAGEPLSAGHLSTLCDDRTVLQHEVLAEVADRLEQRGIELPAMRAYHGALMSGPLWFRHARIRGATDRVHGIRVGSVLLDVADRPGDTDRGRVTHNLAARSQGLPVVAVLEPADIDTGIDLAIDVGLDRREGFGS